MIFDITETTLTALLDDPKRRKPHQLNLSNLMILFRNDVNKIILPTKKFLLPKKYATQRAYLQATLSRLGKYLQIRSINFFPQNFNEWQVLILDWYAWYLSSDTIKASIVTRVSQWDNFVVPWLKDLINEGLLPIGLVVPTNKFRQETIPTTSPRNSELMGEEPVKETDSDRHPINKTIAGPIFWRNDLEYLREIEDTLHSRNKLLKQVTDDYWLRLTKDYRQGRKLLRRVPEDEFFDRVRMVNWRRKVDCDYSIRSTTYRRVTDPRVPDSSAWALKILEYILKKDKDESCFFTKRLQTNKAFMDRFLHTEKHTPIADIIKTTSLRADQILKTDRRTLFARFLGILTPLDMAVALAILIQEHPNLNPESLAEARLLNSRGKSFLLFTDNKSQLIFSVDKPRTQSRKYAVLSRRAQRIIKHVIRSTEIVRQLLRRGNSKHWKYLFIGYSGGAWNILGHPIIRSSLLIADNKQTLAQLYPELSASGLKKGTLSFSKIRSTQGVLEWFSSGSIHKVSRKLGNSYNVVMEHYIPKPLIRLWNERIIRRFQNTLIALAASSEDYLVDVTDMHDYDELMSFLAQILEENPCGHSPIGESLHQRFNTFLYNNSQINSNSILTLNTSCNALALLYAFDQITREKISFKSMCTIEKNTGLSPKHFVDLSKLLRHAAESEIIGEALKESLELSKLRRSHESAIKILPVLVKKFRKLRISSSWS